LLFILLLFCVIQLFDRRGFYFDVLLNISEFVHIHVDVDVENFEASKPINLNSIE
jgi:hypothetical protein